MQGLAALLSKLAAIQDAIAPENTKDIDMDAAQILLGEFRATAPVGKTPHDKHPGLFRDSAFIAPGTPDDPNALFLIDFDVCQYAAVVEYGDSTHAPHATIRQACAAVSDDVSQSIEDGFSDLLSKVTS